MPVAGDINITVTEPDPLGDAAYAWVYGGSPADPGENPADGVWSLIGSIPLNDTTLIDQLDLGAHTHICCRACNVAAPVVSGFTPNYGPFTDWVQLPAAPAPLWRDTFTAPDGTLITARTPEIGGAYTAAAAGGSAVLRIVSNQLKAVDNNDSWATQAVGTTGQIKRVRGRIPNNTGSTSHQGIVIIWSSPNTNGLDGYGARVNTLNGSFDIVQLTDGVVSTLGTPGSGAYIGDDGNAFWIEARGYDDAGTPTLVARVIRASDEVVTGETTHALSPGSLPTGNAGVWFTNALGRFDVVEGYAD